MYCFHCLLIINPNKKREQRPRFFCLYTLLVYIKKEHGVSLLNNHEALFGHVLSTINGLFLVFSLNRKNVFLIEGVLLQVRFAVKVPVVGWMLKVI